MKPDIVFTTQLELG